MVTIRLERSTDIAAREQVLDTAYGPARFAKTSERLREGRLAADGLALENKDVALQGAVTNATEAEAGIAKIATQVLVDGGTNDTDFVTAKKLAESELAASVAATAALLVELRIATRLAQFTLSR